MHHAKTKHISNGVSKAFTLIETMTAIVVFVFAMGAVWALIALAYRSQSYAWQQADAVAQAQRGVETMIKEIRKARGGDDGSYILESAENFQFIFYSNVDNDANIERVRYFIDGSDFKKGVTKSSGWPITYNPANEVISALSGAVRNAPPVFRYFDGQGQELSAPARLKDTTLMRVYLVINSNPNRSPQDFILESDVQIRNLKINL